MCSHYVLIIGIVFICGFNRVLLRCIDYPETKTILREAHDGVCCGHFGTHATLTKILRMGYYWPTLHDNVWELIRKCPACQHHAHLINIPSCDLISIESPGPFSLWGWYLIGQIHLASFDGPKLSIKTTDYFTKWVEAMPLTSIIRCVISRFILSQIICSFIIPHTIVIDNGTQFWSSNVRNFIYKYKMTKKLSIPYYYKYKENGQAEVTNKTLLTILKYTITAYGRDWHTQLYPALRAYCTSIRIPISATPYSLVYGIEVVLPF